MRVPFTKPTLNVIVEDLTTLRSELLELSGRQIESAGLLRVRARELYNEADALHGEAERAERIAEKVAILLS